MNTTEIEYIIAVRTKHNGVREMGWFSDISNAFNAIQDSRTKYPDRDYKLVKRVTTEEVLA